MTQDCTQIKIIATQQIKNKDWVDTYAGSGVTIEVKDLNGKVILSKVVIKSEHTAKLQEALKTVLAIQLVEHERWLRKQLKWIDEETSS